MFHERHDQLPRCLDREPQHLDRVPQPLSLRTLQLGRKKVLQKSSLKKMQRFGLPNKLPSHHQGQLLLQEFRLVRSAASSRRQILPAQRQREKLRGVERDVGSEEN